MTLILSNDDVAELISFGDCLSVLEDMYRDHEAGTAVTRRRTDLLAAGEDGDTYSLKTQDGVVSSAGVAAVRINSDLLRWPESSTTARREKVPRAGGRWVGFVLLFSTSTGEPLAIFPDGVAQRMRVASTSVLAMRTLARTDARTLGLLGAGWQAEAQLRTATLVRDFDEIRCFSPTQQRRETFAAAMSKRLDRQVVASASADEAVADAEVIMCATNTIEPVVRLDWVRPGVHIGVVKVPELPRAVIDAVDIAVVHSPVATPSVFAARGVRERETERDPETLDPETAEGLPQLIDLLSGRIAGRTSDEQTTCFVNSGGLGIQFAALGAVIYERARERGLGHQLPTEWFTEDVHP